MGFYCTAHAEYFMLVDEELRQAVLKVPREIV